MTATRSELGVLGGSFDPPHVAHVMLALYGLSVGGLQRVLVAPTYIHAFGKQLAPFEHRLRMCELAFEHVQPVEVSAIERELGGESRTLRLLQALKVRHPGVPLRLVVGADILEQRARWQQFPAITQLAPLWVAARPGYESGDQPGVLPQVSSTEVRKTIREGGDASAWVPANVLEYIREHGLYRDDACE